MPTGRHQPIITIMARCIHRVIKRVGDAYEGRRTGVLHSREYVQKHRGSQRWELYRFVGRLQVDSVTREAGNLITFAERVLSIIQCVVFTTLLTKQIVSGKDLAVMNSQIDFHRSLSDPLLHRSQLPKHEISSSPHHLISTNYTTPKINTISHHTQLGSE